jgi:beta-lactamase superfamily II metal-dependent hydrolase
MRPEQVGLPEPERVERILPQHLEKGALNLVVFGPGRGEAMVLVLPDGTVGVVDGCREPSSPATGRGDPVRGFLDSLEAQSPKRPLRLGFVCLTHPHDDHYGGLGRLLGAYKDRIDSVWSVLESGERYAEPLLKYIEANRSGSSRTPDLEDVKGLQRFLHAISHVTEPRHTEFEYLSRKKLLFELKLAQHPLQVWGCAPLDKDLRRAHEELVQALRTLERGDKPGVSFDPNITSGVLHIKWYKSGILLGGDLVRGKGRYQGWDAVANDISGSVQVVKVSHHASAEAHHEALWRRLGARLAIVTPFKDADGTQPPRPEQISRLAQDAAVVITSTPKWKEAPGQPAPLYNTVPPATGAVQSARNQVITLSPKPGHNDIYNAVSVSLDATGRVLRFVLAGKANVYEPMAAAPRLRSA